MSPAATDGTDLAARRAAYGCNQFKAIPPKNFFRLWFGNLKDPTLIRLMAAAMVRRAGCGVWGSRVWRGQHACPPP